ncbi:AAA family ATPase [Streptomyces sichuanensis]|uniref:AAA family ATPase n=1 Tax=Streptomyces sichuanensis TaxID=2871810 RepID=UPI0027E1324F|nr:AAA family ATPase [Streptomyces sichuanensis]
MAVTFDAGQGGPQRLAGRSVELSGLMRLAARAREGTAHAVLLRGPAGIGRSALLSAVGDRLHPAGFTVRHHAGRPGDRATGEGRGIRALLGPGAVALSTPADTPAASALDGYAAHRRVHAQALDLMAEGPLALVVDDAQWCDETSLKCLDFVLRRAAARPLLLLMSQRTDCDGPGTPVLAEMLAQDRCTLLDIGPIGDGAIARLIAHVLGDTPDERFVGRCAEVTGGNPRLLHRLLDGLREAGVRPDASGVHRIAAAGEAVAAHAVPAHLAGQPRPVRRVARALAVLGRVDTDLLTALSGVTGTRMTAAMDALRRNDIIVPGEPETMCDPVRTAVLADLPAPELEELRARAARILNDTGRPAAEVAEQLVLLAELDEPWMLDVLRDAATEAPGRAAAEAAVRYLQRALAAGTEAQRRDIRVELARACARIAPAMALWHLREALDAATGPLDRAPIAVEYGLAALHTGRAPEAVRALGRVLDGLHTALGADPAPAEHELRTGVASAFLVTAVNEKAVMATARERARSWPVPHGDSPAERRLLAAMSTYAALDGRPAHEAAALARRSLRVEETAPSSWWVLGASVVLGLADEVDESLAGLERALSGSRTHYEPHTHVAALAGRSLLLYGTGDVPGAAADARAAVDTAEHSERTAGSPMPQIALATVLLSQGKAREAAGILDHVGRGGADRHIWEWHHYLYVQGRIRRELGDLDGALDLWLRCGRSLDEAGVTNPVLAPWWLPATTTLVRMGRTGDATAVVESVEPHIRRWGTPRAHGIGLIAAAVVAEGRVRVDRLAEAVDVLADSPARLEHAKATYQLGHELLARGDARAARRHLRQSIELATRCGYHALSAVARTQLLTAGGRMSQIAVSPLDSLTDSERRIATLARGGISNREIAEALFITPRTVEMHLTNVYRKLDVRGRADLPRQLAAPGPRRTPAAPAHGGRAVRRAG